MKRSFQLFILCVSLVSPIRAQPTGDWASLVRYRDANSALPAPRPDETRVVRDRARERNSRRPCVSPSGLRLPVETWTRTRAEDRVALNGWIRRYAESNGYVYLDYHSAMADSLGGLPPELARDGVHPTEVGYRLMAPLLEAAIARALR